MPNRMLKSRVGCQRSVGPAPEEMAVWGGDQPPRVKQRTGECKVSAQGKFQVSDLGQQVCVDSDL